MLQINNLKLTNSLKNNTSLKYHKKKYRIQLLLNVPKYFEQICQLQKDKYYVIPLYEVS